MKRIVLSFDDGRSDFYDTAYPILKANNLNATLNVITDYIGTKDQYDVDSATSSYVSQDQIKEMINNNIEIASHSSTHTNEINDIKKSISVLRDQYNIDKVGFASPNSFIYDKNIDEYRELDVEYIRSGNVVKRDGILHIILYALFIITKSKIIFYLYNKRNIFDDRYNKGYYKSISINKLVTAKHIEFFINKMKNNQNCILMFHSILDEKDLRYAKTLWCNKKSDFEKLCQFLANSNNIQVMTNMDLNRG